MNSFIYNLCLLTLAFWYFKKRYPDFHKDFWLYWINNCDMIHDTTCTTCTLFRDLDTELQACCHSTKCMNRCSFVKLYYDDTILKISFKLVQLFRWLMRRRHFKIMDFCYINKFKNIFYKISNICIRSVHSDPHMFITCN